MDNKYMLSVLIIGFLVKGFSGLEYDPISDEDLTTEEVIAKYRYPIENHYTTTQDGYILHLHRIPYGRNGRKPNSKPVLVMHGFEGISKHFILLGPNTGLAYILADNGYDVWLANARGNMHSRNHTILDPNSKEFWKFSWHEIGAIDFPDTIDYILNITGYEKLYCIAYSQGGTAMFVMLSDRPEYNEKLYLGVALAPVVFVKHFVYPSLLPIIERVDDIAILLENQHIYEMFPNNTMIIEILKGFCGEGSLFRRTCLQLFLETSRVDPAAVDMNILEYTIINLLGGASIKQPIHSVQIIAAGGDFQKFDYKEKNMEVYNQETPPKYNLSNVVAPIAIYYGNNDLLITHEDISTLARSLPNVVHFEEIKNKKFGHLDFFINKYIVKLLYKPLMRLLEQYT